MEKPYVIEGTTTTSDRINSSGKVIGQIRNREWSTGWIETHVRKKPGARWSFRCLSPVSHEVAA